MADDFSALDFLTDPDQARAREMVAARRRALRGRLPGAMALALGPQTSGQAVGRELLGQTVPEEHQLDALAEAKLQAQHRRVQEAQGWAGLAQGRWAPKVWTDPTTGQTIAVMVDTRTGRTRPLGPATSGLPAMAPSHAPGSLPPLPALKLTEHQGKVAGGVGGTIDAMRNALEVGFPKPGLHGVGQMLGQEAMQRGYPAFASPDAQETYSAWYNVIRPLVNLRTGQQMSNQELTREFNALAPRPGMSDPLMFRNVRLLPRMMRRFAAELPPPLRDRLNAEYDQVEAMLPQSVQDIDRMRASRERAAGSLPQTAPQRQPVGTIGGRPVYQGD